MASRKSRSSRKSRNSARATVSRTSQNMAAGAQAAQQSSQQQLALAAQLTAAMFHGAELWHQVQSQMWQRTGTAWRDAAEEMRDAHGMIDAIDIQKNLWVTSYMQAMQVGQDMLRAALAVQPELQEPAQQEMTSTVEAMAPMVQAWQSMLSPPGMSGGASRLH